jgi:hypothetical protein
MFCTSTFLFLCFLLVAGDPFVLDQSPDTKSVRDAYTSLAKSVHEAVSRLKSEAAALPTVNYDPQRGVLLQLPAHGTTAGQTLVLNPYELRKACQCAACVDEMTGVPRIRAQSIKPDVKPLGIQRRGNYAVAVHWSDGKFGSFLHDDCCPLLF